MFYKPTGKAKLSQAEMERVRNGFSGLLAKLRYHPEFIANNFDELLAIAHAEYVRYVEKGIEIEDPVSWTINCAWRRTQNFLKLTNYRPQEVSSEMLAELVDETTPTPAQIAEDADRARKVRRAVGKLDVEQRQLLALMYFEGMALAEAARYLGWHESKARRCHTAAKKRLYRFLAVKSSDDLEVGLAAWLSFAGSRSLHLPGGVEAALDKAEHGASGLWARGHELARRFNLGGGSDAAGAVASSGAGRTAGVCATVAVACVAGASGVVGPGIGGGIGLLGDHSHSHVSKLAAEPRPASDSLGASATALTNPAPAQAAAEGSGFARTSSASSGEAGGAGAQASAKKGARRQVKEQTDGLARASSESSATEAVSPPSASTSSTPTATEATATAPSGSAGSGTSSEAAQAKQQFGAFK
ncbi:MAG TPA: sigma factor-like helix-turn-helix DNA-binding protein [Solirubrobacterales bacterium]|jgi:DNA-directed RNA polymerase specialized sigma24 family protein